MRPASISLRICGKIGKVRQRMKAMKLQNQKDPGYPSWRFSEMAICRSLHARSLPSSRRNSTGCTLLCRKINSFAPEVQKPVKVYYIGSMFRYERPQAGRLREFHQLGVECFGSKNPATDVETIAMAYQLFLIRLALRMYPFI